MAIDTSSNYGFQKPAVGKNLSALDLIKAVSNNADGCDAQLKRINDAIAIDTNGNINIQNGTVWGADAFWNFASAHNATHQARIGSYSGSQPAGNLFFEPQNYFVIRSLFSTSSTNVPVNGTIYGNLNITGNFGVSGAKNRLVQTKSYGQIGLNAIESAECWFTDVGESILINGECRIDFDKKFLETVNTNVPYQIQTWGYDGGDVTVYKKDMHLNYFIVRAKNNSADCPFGYKIYAKQLGYEDVRLKEIDNHIPDNTSKYAKLYFKDKLNNNKQNSGE